MSEGLKANIRAFLDYCLDQNRSRKTVTTYEQVLGDFADWLGQRYPAIQSVSRSSVRTCRGTAGPCDCEAARRRAVVTPFPSSSPCALAPSIWRRFVASSSTSRSRPTDGAAEG